MQGVHHGPCNVGVAGGLGPRGAEGDLAAVGGAALDGQEGLSDLGPARIPFDPTRPNHVLGLEHQGGLGFKAVVDALRPRVEIAHQVVDPDAYSGGVDANVLHVEAFGDLLHLAGLVGERLPTPGMLFQDPELATRLRRWRDHNTRRIVSSTARVVAHPYRSIAEGAVGFLVVVVPRCEVAVTTLQILECER